jgi:hypothetical protein
VTARRIDQDMAAAAAGMLPRPVTQELRTRYRQLRVILHNAGLAATYAFIAAKAGQETGPLARAYDEAGRGIRKRLVVQHLLEGDPAGLDAQKVLAQLGAMPGPAYARASTEAAALMSWLSRLADACYQEDKRLAEAGGPAGSEEAGAGQ